MTFIILTCLMPNTQENIVFFIFFQLLRMHRRKQYCYILYPLANPYLSLAFISFFKTAFL